MNANQRNRVISVLRGYGVTGFILLLFYEIFHKGFAPDGLSYALYVWGDGLTITGALLLGVAAFSWMNRKGCFDFMGYAVEQAKLLASSSQKQEYLNYYDYKTTKQRGSSPIWPGVGVAVIWLSAGIALTMLYLSA